MILYAYNYSRCLRFCWAERRMTRLHAGWLLSRGILLVYMCWGTSSNDCIFIPEQCGDWHVCGQRLLLTRRKAVSGILAIFQCRFYLLFQFYSLNLCTCKAIFGAFLRFREIPCVTILTCCFLSVLFQLHIFVSIIVFRLFPNEFFM